MEIQIFLSGEFIVKARVLENNPDAIPDRVLLGSTSWPHTKAVPTVVGRIVERMEIRVVLPAPLGPNSPNSSPFSISRSILSRAVRLPNFFVNPLTTMAFEATPPGKLFLQLVLQ